MRTEVRRFECGVREFCGVEKNPAKDFERKLVDRPIDYHQILKQFVVEHTTYRLTHPMRPLGGIHSMRPLGGAHSMRPWFDSRKVCSMWMGADG